MTSSSPELEILVREPDGVTLWRGPPFSSPSGEPTSRLPKIACSAARFADDGSRLVVTGSEGVVRVYDCASLGEVAALQLPSLVAAALSPKGTFLQTYQKASSPQEKNVRVWRLGHEEAVYQVFMKNLSKDNWPVMQFSADESVACRLATNEIQFFDPQEFSKGIIYRLRVPNVAAFELARSPSSHVATFVPESKGVPASVQIFSCNKETQGQAVARRSFFRCSSVKFHWNNGSSGLLVVAVADVDKTNQSYYGESKLNYLTTDGTHEGLVPLKKDGPVHDVQWSSTGCEFAAVYGFIPAKATIFNRKCSPLVELGEGPFNTIRFNPKGRFICLAGFGNLPGEMAFWDYSEKKLLGRTKAEWSVSSEWSADGRYFMTTTTAPRLQVDNGIKIFHVNGSLYFKKMFEKLYQVDWKPEAAEKFDDIADLVKSTEDIKIEEGKSQAQGAKSLQSSSKPSTSTASKLAPGPISAKPAAYCPPHAKAAAEVQEKLFGGLATPTQEMSKNALKNKKRREKQKEKKAAESSAIND